MSLNMSALTKEQLVAIRASINTALAAVAEQNGLASLRAGNCNFNPDGSFRFQLDGVIAGGLDKEASLYEATRKFNKALPERGTPYVDRGRTYTITGLRGSKIRIERDGKPFYINMDFVLKQLERVS